MQPKSTASTLLLASSALCQVTPVGMPQAQNVNIIEAVICQGESSRVLDGSAVRSVAEVVGSVISGQAASPTCILSANLLTDRFQLMLMAPPLLVVSDPLSRQAMALSWTQTPSMTLAEGYRLRVYTGPSRSGSPQVLEYAGYTATTGSVNIGSQGSVYVDAVAYRGATVSDPTEMVKVTFTSRRDVGDCNGDGMVDGKDLMEVLAASGTQPSVAGWNPAADCNGDGQINASDVTVVSQNMGWHQ